MKKLFAMAICFAVFFAACDNPAGDEAITTLTIRNESTHEITQVLWSNVSFTVGENSISPGENATRNVQPGSGFIRLDATNIESGYSFRLRTQQLVSVAQGEQIEFVVLNSTIVVDEDNSNSTLGQISFEPRAVVERGNMPVARNEEINLGRGVVNVTSQSMFTIRNTGACNLLFSGNAPVQISDDANNAFSVKQPTSPVVAPSNYLPFAVNFTPRTFQTYSATVTIRTNDEGGDYVFSITATGVAPAPIASVVFEGTTIEQNGTVNVGEVLFINRKNVAIGIENTGTATLAIDTVGITITGDHAAAFTLLTHPASSISAGGQSSAVIEFSPLHQGENSAVLTIPTNDNYRNPIVVYIRAIGLSPNATPLIQNTWADGTTLGDGDQFFMFTATAVRQFVHVDFHTQAILSLNIQLYDRTGTAVGAGANFSRFDSGSNSIGRELSVGQRYYIRIRATDGAGAYRIGFNMSAGPPGTTALAASSISSGSVTHGNVRWFRFTATKATQFVHWMAGGASVFFSVYVFDNNGAPVETETNHFSASSIRVPLVIGQEYYIRMQLIVSGASGGQYTIRLTTSFVSPLDAVIELWEDAMEGPHILSGDPAMHRQWFRFTATAETQFIHISSHVGNSQRVRLFDANGFPVGAEVAIHDGGYLSRPVTIGRAYYVQIIRTFGGNMIWVGFNASATPP